ncbi:transposase [Streptomyces spinoverrucosus]|uniref:RNA-guided endonuclease InsQ/TnpB family protein n=1 Tax=Streptomyces spinoverrucosus TaxID=284043 RepID=UPI0018C44395|nr:RNA-guided endonuclease TnpB family protein [Streptomyces spinoverrucosus]MBG0851804.1 transposase [Streptomyces spinoverrucosus]
MRRSYKFLLRPTQRQEQTLRDHCHLYNAALQERRDAYRHASKKSISYGQQSAQLSEIRAFDPEQARWSFSSQQATLRRLNKASAAFFSRIKKGEKAGYPRFRGTGHFDTVEFPKNGDGCRWDSTPRDPQTRVRLQGVGHVRVHRHRPVLGRVKTVSVKREGRRWYVILACDDVPAEPLPATGSIVGIDMGTVHFFTDSNGNHVTLLDTFPKHRGAARKVAKLHTKVRRQRLDHHHKTANALVQKHEVIAHERLNAAGKTKRPAPKPDPNRDGGFLPNKAAPKAGLNRSIMDAGWGLFLGILASKAESAGRRVIPVDAHNTSRTCPECGHVAKENRASQAEFKCAACGFAANADHVGALNILNRAGLALCAP